MKWAGLLALALLGSGALAVPEIRAASHEQIGCPIDPLRNAERIALGEAMREGAGFDDPRVRPLRRAAALCAQRWNWSDPALNYAVRFHGALAAQRAQRRWLAAAGVDVEEIGRMARQDEAAIAAIVNMGAGSASEFEAALREATGTRYTGPLERALLGLGNVSRERYGDMAEETGRYMGYVVATEALRRLFIAS